MTIKMFDNLDAPATVVDSAEDDSQGWLLRQVIALASEQSSKRHSQLVKRGIAQARARRAAEATNQTASTKVACQHCAGRGWTETAVSSADVSSFVVED